jgi:multidrug efflux pump
LELDPALTQGLDGLNQTYIHNANGEAIQLSAVASIEQKE